MAITSRDLDVELRKLALQEREWRENKARELKALSPELTEEQVQLMLNSTLPGEEA